MNSIAKLKLNTIVSLLNQIVVIISGLLLPRLLLLHFGSELYGLTASLTQFLSIIVFLDFGVGSVVQSALYGPLARKQYDEVSKVLVSAKLYFRKIAYFILLYLLLLIVLYPVVIQENFDFISTSFLIFAMSISMFGRYYFGIVNELLLNADQRSYIQYGAEIITITLNLLITFVLIQLNFSIQVVKLFSGFIYLIRPLYLTYYVKRNYEIDYTVERTDEPLKQKWNGLAQHIANTVQNSTDIVVITLFSSLEMVSIYAVHNMIVANLKILVLSLIASFKPFLGELYVKNNVQKLNKYFDKIEWVIHTFVIFIFSVASVLIDSFVHLYTEGVPNSFYAPTFSLLLIIGQIFYLIRQPYHMMILAAGHFKETQTSSIVEATLNIVLSVILVQWLGLPGVAIGTIFAMVYRTLYLIIYLSNNILNRSPKIFLKLCISDGLIFLLVWFLGGEILGNLNITTLYYWLISAIIVSFLALSILVLINLLFQREIFIMVIKKVLRI